MTSSAKEYIESMTEVPEDDVPGWFHRSDALLLDAVNELQGDHGVHGDLLEIGVYKGKSAVLLGYYPRQSEKLVVCDIFQDTSTVDAESRAESATFFKDLTREVFEGNYLRFHPELPVVHAMPSAELDTVLPAGSCRLVHVDGGHAYDVVRQDLATARHALGPGGVLVLDDWSSSHVAGVAMAFWREYAKGELVPLAFTDGKFYATWDQNGLTAQDVDAAAAARPELKALLARRLGEHEARYYCTPQFPLPW